MLREEDGAGCLTLLASVAGAVIVFAVLLGVSGEAALGWVALCLAGAVVWGNGTKRRRRRRRSRRRRAREARRVRRAGYALRPVDADTVLPPVWAEPVDAAAVAVDDYRRTVGQMPGGPVRDRLEAGIPAMRQGARRCDELARRSAELERQLRHMRVRTAGSSRWAGTGPPATAADPFGEQRLRQDVEQLARSVGEARAALQARSKRLQMCALRAAQVALATSVTGPEQGDGVDDVLHDVAVLARALQELQELESPTSPSAAAEAPVGERAADASLADLAREQGEILRRIGERIPRRRGGV